MSKPLADQFLGVFADVLSHAETCHPREACGLLVRVKRKTVYWPCANLAPLQHAKDSFRMDPADWVAAQDAGTILAVVHSHPDGDCRPSDADKWMCHRSGVPWFVVAVPGGAWSITHPAELPLLGREFAHGVVDCYTLVQDYFAQRLQIALPDFERKMGWWEGRDGKPPANLYANNFAAAGFVEMGPVALRPHDVLLMMVGARVENHAAVYLGDAVDGRGELIMHHLLGRLSCEDVWGGDWAWRTTRFLRHGSLL